MRLKVGILGTRGIPANYGGFETFAEELAVRLVRRGHRVTVYGRSHFVDPQLSTYRGVRVRVLPAIRQKYLETVSHTALSVLRACFRGYDVCLVCNAANAFLCWLPRLAGQRVVLNVDGIERKRKKWNWLGRSFHRMGESLAVRFPDCFVTDARTTQDYYLSRYRRKSPFIPLRGAGGAPGEPRGLAEAGSGGEPVSAVREPAGAGEQRPSGDPRLPEIGRGPPVGDRGRRSLQPSLHRPASATGRRDQRVVAGSRLREGVPGAALPLPLLCLRGGDRRDPSRFAGSHGSRAAWCWSTISRKTGKPWPTPASSIPSTTRRGSPDSWPESAGAPRITGNCGRRRRIRVRRRFDWERITEQYEELFYGLL